MKATSQRKMRLLTMVVTVAPAMLETVTAAMTARKTITEAAMTGTIGAPATRRRRKARRSKMRRKRKPLPPHQWKRLPRRKRKRISLI